ncbi:MAG: hypothetical protein FWB95_04745 [Treponema sp.]|nr:hypothetical protein [Treponema sp.]
MRKYLFVIILSLFTLNCLYAQLSISGVLDSTVSMNIGAGDAPVFSIGLEEYANLRFQAKLRDKATIYGAVNLLAAVGDYAANAALMASKGNDNPLSFSAFIAGDNYIAALELERLYFRLHGERTDFDGGLMRIPFGFGQIWAPSDFLNPRNPLKPDARLRGALGAALSFYPMDEMKLLVFYSAPRNPFSSEGKGSFVGLSFDKHWNKVSIQSLYSYETPNGNQAFKSSYGIHRIGFSLKADIEIGLYVDTLYTYNHEARTEWDGFSFSAGADYSFVDGKLIVLAEYLYNGATSSTAYGYGGNFSNNHYLYTGLTVRFNDFTSMNTTLISCFDDISFSALISVSRDLFQGATLTVSAQIPFDRDLFRKDGNRGELGPIPPDSLQALLPITGERLGRYFNLTARIRFKF